MSKAKAFLLTLMLALSGSAVAANVAAAQTNWCGPIPPNSNPYEVCQTLYSSGTYLHVGNAEKWLAETYLAGTGYEMRHWTEAQWGLGYTNGLAGPRPEINRYSNTQVLVTVDWDLYTTLNHPYCYWQAIVGGSDLSMGLQSTITSGCFNY